MEKGETNLLQMGIEEDLLDTKPEFVSVEKLEDGKKIYIVGLLINNDYMPLIYIPDEENWPGRVIEWLCLQI